MTNQLPEYGSFGNCEDAKDPIEELFHTHEVLLAEELSDKDEKEEQPK